MNGDIVHDTMLQLFQVDPVAFKDQQDPSLQELGIAMATI